MEEDKSKLNPGSEEAIANGCMCPVMDNRRGKGMYTDKDGTPVFVISANCPLHGTVAKTFE